MSGFSSTVNPRLMAGADDPAMDEPPSWALAEGDEIAPGRHAIEPIGGGRRYEAYLVWDDELHALAVGKLLRPDQIADEAALAILGAEARALDELGHPHLVRGFDLVPDGERPHLLLELVEGPRLSTLAHRYGVVAEQLLPLALCICSALHYIHARGYVHLDVKPRNIIMSATPRLIDLSLARPFAAAAAIELPTGTDAYMAPEQCDPVHRRSEIGPSADVWGLGVTLYEALAAQLPWRAGESRFPQLDAGPAPLERGVGLASEAAAAVEACLAPRPSDRPTAAELAAALERAVDELPAPRIGRFKPGSGWRRASAGPSADLPIPIRATGGVR